MGLGQPKIIRKGTRNLPLTKKQMILRAIYFTPLTILLLERLYIPLEYADLAAYLNVETVAVTRVAKNPTNRTADDVLPLSVLTRSSQTWTFVCPRRTDTVTNVDLPDALLTVNHRKIPRIVHQTAKSRCVTPAFAKITGQWKLPDHSYYFHDDEAIARLLRMNFPLFPHLNKVVGLCVKNPTIKADLWRYLVLWVYGGIYADFDTAPAKFNADTIQPDDDGLFLVEQDHLLSQWFMAVSPHHPLMFYAIHMTLQNLFEAGDMLIRSVHMKSGPLALQEALTRFRADADGLVDPFGPGTKQVWGGSIQGTNNRTITVVGRGDDDNEYVQRMAIDVFTRERDYTRMGMRHFPAFMEPKAKKSGETCYDALLAPIMTASNLQLIV